MVHLSTIPHEDDINEHLVHDVKKTHLNLASEADCFTTSVYGTKFAATDLPRLEMPVCCSWNSRVAQLFPRLVPPPSTQSQVERALRSTGRRGSDNMSRKARCPRKLRTA